MTIESLLEAHNLLSYEKENTTDTDYIVTLEYLLRVIQDELKHLNELEDE